MKRIGIVFNFKISLIHFIISMFLLFSSLSAAGQEPRELEKIRYLISSVETLQGAHFIRNGSEYDAGKAAKHLRLKLNKAGTRVKTAEDFITLCASRSSISGEPYRIRFENGATIETETFFRNKLKAFAERKDNKP